MLRIGSLAAIALLVVSGAVDGQPRIVEMPSPTIRSLEESVELLDAALDVKRAYVKAAEVGVLAAKSHFNLLARANLPAADVDQAKFALATAEAKLEIRKAEMREVEVKLKQVKKRLDETKAGPEPKPK